MNGVICIDKPSGMTSFDVVAIMRRLVRERKVGHAGTLDPMATGVLPVFFGDATKAVSLLPNHDKRYTAWLRLGLTTDTGDITGKVISSTDVFVTSEEVMEAVHSFKGEIKQIPPMYSALKVGGRHLYDIAREGGVVEREARSINIYDIKLVGRDRASGDYIIDVFCSQGTYIRTLCEDIGKMLGCGAVMSRLHRTYAAGFDIAVCHTLEEAKAFAEKDKLSEIILDVEKVFEKLPEVSITAKQAIRFRNGGALSFDRLKSVPVEGLCRVKFKNYFLGLGEARPDKRQINVKCHFNREIQIEDREVFQNGNI